MFFCRTFKGSFTSYCSRCGIIECEKQGLGKAKVDVIVVEVSAQWKCMNKEERSDATDNLMQSLGDQREMKDLALHNVPLNAFQDGRKTLDSIDREVCFYLI
jgi:hypothetical protein